MCARFTLRFPVELFMEMFGLVDAPRLPLRYNIAPGQDIAAIRSMGPDDERRLDLQRWGLIPPWAKKPADGARFINARSETAATKPAFREAFRTRRCLIPADGFYEWKTTGSGKQPFYFHAVDERPFAFAGLWGRWNGAEHEIETCTILTTEPNGIVEPVHNRMPVILFADEDRDLWLDESNQDVASLQSVLRPAGDDRLAVRTVSRRVNRVSCDDAMCIEGVEIAEEGLGLFGE